MREIIITPDFNVDELTGKINNLMSKWSIHLLDIDGAYWHVKNHENETKFLFHFQVDFTDIETRIKLEDLKLNIIYHIESLKDDTIYVDNLNNAF